MPEGLKYLVSLDRPAVEILRDFADIFVVAFMLYRALLVLKGTRAMQMGIGFVAFGGLYLLAKYAELATLMQVLSWLAGSAILILVVVFQNDIRRALIRVGSKAWFTRAQDAQHRIIEEVVAAATELARHRIGALICMERDANVLEFVKNDGIELDALVSRDLLVSLFIPEAENKSHDGAVLIRDLRVSRAGIFFPMPETTKVQDPTLGSRHRAAIGITEETDAIVIVVSEERGSITLVFKDGTMAPNLSGEDLRTALLGLFGRKPETEQGRRLPLLRRSKASPAIAVKAPKTEMGTGPITVPKTVAVSRTASIPPPTSDRERSSPSIRPPAVKVTKQSGGFRPLRHDDLPEDMLSPAGTPRVSVPMPSPKERKSVDSPPRGAEGSPGPYPGEEPRSPSRTSVSKPMTPTDLPTTLPSDSNE